MSGLEKGRVLFGVLGETLKHSLSPAMFAVVLPQVVTGGAYLPFEMPAGRLEELVSALRLLEVGGFNVTIPHKTGIIPFLDQLTRPAQAIGAVNCVTAVDDQLVGHNTDVSAFGESLAVLRQRFSSALVLGAGGAARAVVFALRELEVGSIFVAARRPAAPAEEDLFAGCSFVPFKQESMSEIARGCDLVVNATPVGMFPHGEFCPLSAGFHSGQIAYDLVYLPRPTRFLQFAQSQGATTVGGLEMLARQAAESLRIWTGARVSYMKFLSAAERELRRR